MEPPDAWARTRGAPRLLVLALLLGAQPGMLGLRAGCDGGRPLETSGRKKEGSFTHRGKSNLETPERRDMIAPLAISETPGDRSWGYHDNELEATGEVRVPGHSGPRSTEGPWIWVSGPCSLRTRGPGPSC